MTGQKPATLTLTLTNNPESIGRVLDRLTAVLDEHRIDPADAGRLMTLADEATSNVSRYAWDDQGTHEFLMLLTVEPAGPQTRLRLVVDDDGVPFDPTATATPRQLDRTLEEIEPGSLGVYLLQELSDGLSYRREGCRNRLEMIVMASSDNAARKA